MSVPLPGWLFKGNREFYYPRAFFVLEIKKMERATKYLNKENGFGVKYGIKNKMIKRQMRMNLIQ